MGILERVGGVHTIYLGRLEHHVGINFNGAQTGGRVRGKERITRTGGKDHHFAHVQVAHGLAAIIVIGHTDHGDGRHHQCRDIRTLQRITHGQGIHHGGEHTHVVARNPIHTSSAQRSTTEQVTATDHQADLHADADQLADFQGHAIKHLRVDAELFRANQGLAAKFEQNAFIARLTTTHLLSHCVSLLRRLNTAQALQACTRIESWTGAATAPTASGAI